MNNYKLVALVLFFTISTKAQFTPQKIESWWGKTYVRINNKIDRFKDCKVWPGHSKNWDWSQTNTHHVPGVQVADFQEFLDDIDILILTEGYDGVLKIKPETIAYLNIWAVTGKEYYIQRTPRAVALYNQLSAQGKRVGILLHSTC